MPRRYPLLVIRIERGSPTPQELAALVGAVLAAGRVAPSAPAIAVSRWAASARPTGPGVRPGPGGWRASSLATVR